MSSQNSDTIFAQSSAVGKAGIAVFRISGPRAIEVLKSLSHRHSFAHRKIYNVTLTHQVSMHKIDDALVAVFHAPHSFTGEDIVELYTHGSTAIAKLLTSAILAHERVRLATAGEFTLRAVLNNKIDITSAEGIVDLISAETEMQHKQAIRQASGKLKQLYDHWRNGLLKLIAMIEAYIDFPDEDIPIEITQSITQTLNGIVSELEMHLNDNRRGEILREGIFLTIYGKPNVGKSTLSNYLAQRDISIVSDVSGTTRDVVQTYIDIGGYPIILSDTAGLNDDTSNQIELEGIKRTHKTLEMSDIRVHLLDHESLLHTQNRDHDTLTVINKIDTLPNTTVDELKLQYPDTIFISVKQNLGMNDLRDRIVLQASKVAMPSERPAITRERHRHIVHSAIAHLSKVDLTADIVIAAENIRIATYELGKIVGKVNVEDVLGEIFSNFCIGK